MPEPVTYVIAVVCDADRRAATLLSDRVLRETTEWISPETLPYLRRYRGLGDQDPYLKCSRSPPSIRAPDPRRTATRDSWPGQTQVRSSPAIALR
jgi:hypothetical protein